MAPLSTLSTTKVSNTRHHEGKSTLFCAYKINTGYYPILVSILPDSSDYSASSPSTLGYRPLNLKFLLPTYRSPPAAELSIRMVYPEL